MAVTLNANTSTGFIATSDTSGVLQLQTGGTTAVTVDASQLVGIGTSSPSYKLDVVKTSAGSAVRIWDNTDSSPEPTLYLQRGTNATWGADAYTDYKLMATAGTFTISGGESGVTTERMRIDSRGVVKINRTTDSSIANNAILQILMSNSNNAIVAENTNATPYGIDMYYSGAAPNNTGSAFYYASDTGGARFISRSNGGIANYSGNNVNLSDRREKTNFAPAGDYLAKICAIPVQTFNYIDQNLEEDGGLTLGVVAQDVQAVAPEMVMESNWGTEDEPKMRLSIYQTDLQYALMKCIQEQQAIITSLTDRITALEGTTP